MKKKVYLSKSNMSNPNVLIQMRNDLINAGFEILEWVGGPYNRELPGTGDINVVITHPGGLPGSEGFNNEKFNNQLFVPKSNEVFLGMGILGELNTGLNAGNDGFVWDGSHLRQVEGIEIVPKAQSDYKYMAGIAKFGNEKYTVEDLKTLYLNI